MRRTRKGRVVITWPVAYVMRSEDGGCDDGANVGGIKKKRHIIFVELLVLVGNQSN